MSEIVRLYKYKELLLGKRAVPRQELMERLEISEATFKRDLARIENIGAHRIVHHV
jgi:predicted DNA-binding transcriptional regulator YafY